MAVEVVLTTSMEDYMETILQIFIEKKGVRVSDIAKRMDVSKPSVTGALQALARQGLVNHEPYDVISLTDKGEQMARGVLNRHEVLRRFLKDVLVIPEKDAESTACGLEHAMTPVVTEKLAALVESISRCPLAKTGCISAMKMARSRA